MGKGHNETPVYSRNMGLKYRAEYDANNYVVYEGWALDPGAAEGDNKWQVCKHTRDTNGNITQTNWANSSDDFSFIWTNRATYTY